MDWPLKDSEVMYDKAVSNAITYCCCTSEKSVNK